MKSSINVVPAISAYATPGVSILCVLCMKHTVSERVQHEKSLYRGVKLPDKISCVSTLLLWLFGTIQDRGMGFLKESRRRPAVRHGVYTPQGAMMSSQAHTPVVLSMSLCAVPYATGS